MNNSISDNLWTKFICGDEKALSKLYYLHVDKLYYYGLRIHPNDQFIKDCIQEVFCNLIKNKKKIAVSQGISYYLFKAFRNKVLEELRSKNKQDYILKNFLFQKKDEKNVEELIIGFEEADRKNRILTEILDILTPYQREAIHLKYTEGFDYQKIADILNIDIPSVRTLIYRSIKKIKESLSGKRQELYPFQFKN